MSCSFLSEAMTAKIELGILLRNIPRQFTREVITMWQENWREKLNEYRHSIDEIDSRLLELLSKRTELSEKIGEIKHEHGLPIFLPEREAEVINNRQELGRLQGLRGKFVRVIFKLIMYESKQIQKNLVRA